VLHDRPDSDLSSRLIGVTLPDGPLFRTIRKAIPPTATSEAANTEIATG
jgi:hypothetical protein